MTNTRLAITLAALTAATAGSLPAQDSTAKPKPIVFHSDIGYVNTSGNSQVSTLNFTDQLTWHTSDANKIDQTFGIIYGESNNKVTTSIWTAAARDEYSFTKAIGLYALVAFDRNTFAGIKQRFEEGAGVAVTAFQDKRHHLELDGGFSYVEQQSLGDSAGAPDSTDNHAAARLALLYKYTFGKDTYAQVTVEGIPNLQDGSDYRVNSETDLVAPLSRHIALKLGYQIRYANLPPPGFKTTDRLFTSDVQLTF